MPVIVSLPHALPHYLKPSVQVLDADIWETADNKPKLQPFWTGFCQRQKNPSFSDATSTVSFFCSRRPQKLGVRSCSALNNPTEEWESCSEWIVWPEFSHGCGKFGSWFQNLPVSWLQLSFQLSKLNVLDVAVNSAYDCIDDHLIQSNNISGKKKILVLHLVLRRPVLPAVKVIFQRVARDTFTWWLSRLGVRTNHRLCLV